MQQIRKNLPIALFDSGVGGLSIFRVLSRLLPSENIIYFADNKRAPYGDKSPDTIIEYTLDAASSLQNMGMKMLVVACHTSSAHCLEVLQRKMEVPVIGVIQSGLESVVEIPHCRRIGILGTKSTIESAVYQRLIRSWNSEVKIIPIACPLLVPLIEKGLIHHPDMASAIQSYVEPFQNELVDAVLLACTHYPLIRPLIQSFVGEGVRLLEASHRTVLEIKATLQNENLLREEEAGKHEFYVTDAPKIFARLASLFLNIEINPKLL